MDHSRRQLLRSIGAIGVLPLVTACSTPLPLVPPPSAGADPDAARLVAESADAHGLSAYRALSDVNVAYTGVWRPLIGGIQPEIVDAGYRVSSEERFRPADRVYAQTYAGPQGRKQVARHRGAFGGDDLGTVSVWFDGTRSGDRASQQAAALVADGYLLFLLGPLWLADAPLPMRRAGIERVDGRDCDVVEAWLSPGLGLVGRDRIALCIDRRDRLTRRVRFTLEGFPGTRGAVAEVDTHDHARHFGVTWPMRSYERVVHPLALPAHDWHITGLDVDRGYPSTAIGGPVFLGAAQAPARSV